MLTLANRKSASLLAIAGASILLAAACSEIPTAPQPGSRLQPPKAAARDDMPECRTGYVMIDGRLVCGD